MAQVNVKCLLYGAGSTEGGRWRMSMRIRLCILCILPSRIHCAAVLMLRHVHEWLQSANCVYFCASCKIFRFCCMSLKKSKLGCKYRTMKGYLYSKKTVRRSWFHSHVKPGLRRAWKQLLQNNFSLGSASSDNIISKNSHDSVLFCDWISLIGNILLSVM